MLIVNADLTEADHVHPEEPATRGPVITFQPLMPAAGTTNSGFNSSVTAPSRRFRSCYGDGTVVITRSSTESRLAAAFDPDSASTSQSERLAQPVSGGEVRIVVTDPGNDFLPSIRQDCRDARRSSLVERWTDRQQRSGGTG